MAQSGKSFIVVFLLISAAAAQSRIDCSAIKSRILGEPIRYCVLLPASYDSAKMQRYPILYFLHGLGESEKSLFDTGGWTLIDDLQEELKIGQFLIVAPEGKSSFYINSADGKFRYSDFFLREFMPRIESKYRVRRERAFRGITGVSMGGYGALRFAFAYPQLFGSVSAQSAALITESPQELNGAGKSGLPMTRVIANVFGDPINLAHWRQNAPFALAKKNQAELRGQAIYFNCGKSDEYNFEIGAKALDRELTAEHVGHEFHLYPGDHSLDYFMDHIGETLEFHSRVFEKAPRAH
ncbi:MAG TPA: alpha/beta hydrolase-fold protein [Terriglobales bacterium]|nr:alpha/beta hydrolase-fold protein [Terriglobales bacterium]